MDKAKANNRHLKQLEQNLEKNVSIFEQSLKKIEKKYVDARILFEKGKEKNFAIEKLTDEIGTIKVFRLHSELVKVEDVLNKYKRYKNILFKLSSPEWQEAQEAEALKAKVLSDGDAQDEQNRPQESSLITGSERGLESSPAGVLPSTTLSSAHNDTLVTHCKLDSESSEYKEKLELYFSDPQQLLDLMMELTEQNLSLLQNSTRFDETLLLLRQAMETTSKKMKEDDEKLTVQVNDMKDSIDEEKERAATLKKKVQLHDSLQTDDQDAMLDALGVKVTEVHRCFIDSRLTNLSTLEKLSSVEYRMSLLLQLVESIPEENLETLRQIKDSERRSRLREEKLRLEMEKQKERMLKFQQRSLDDTKKISGRKLMPRSSPVEQKIKVSDEDNIPAEEELHAYLFTTEDIE
ncbi:cilia- and flagella-associated protein 100-like [Cottoperca gobio]|uniref:Cilia- and flagella-associated protein 100-like n=1 Tax=Cottoperca gobio TaxID=56716 RepID=A0A6J2QE35_COTGO|nr:cilia- and flagella-associated protein 100-like [Cottoperca gobio]